MIYLYNDDNKEMLDVYIYFDDGSISFNLTLKIILRFYINDLFVLNICTSYTKY